MPDKTAGKLLIAAFIGASALGVAAIGAGFSTSAVPEIMAGNHEKTARALVRYAPGQQQYQLDNDLEAALLQNRLEMADFFIARGADPVKAARRLDLKDTWDGHGNRIDWSKVDADRDYKFLLRHGAAENEELAVYAAMAGDAQKLRLIAKYSSKPFSANVLSHAAWGDGPAAVDYLLDNFDFSAADKQDALKAAAKSNKSENFQHILDRFTPDQATKDNILIETADNADSDVLDICLKKFTYTPEIKQKALEAAASGTLKHPNAVGSLSRLLADPGIPRACKTAALHDILTAQPDLTGLLVKDAGIYRLNLN